MMGAKSDRASDVSSMISFDKALNKMNEKLNRLEINLMECLNCRQVGGGYNASYTGFPR